MTSQQQKPGRVAVIGGTGFVGGYVVETLVGAGYEPSVLVRPGSEDKLEQASACRVVPGDLGDREAIGAALDGADAVIYLVGILREFPRRGITFEETQYRGVVRTVDEAVRRGVRRCLLMSANGVEARRTPYEDTKYRAEEYVRSSGLDYTIFRPSVIFGDPHGTMEIATQLYREMIRPPLPAVAFHRGLLPSGGRILMSPVHAADVAEAFVKSLDEPATSGRMYRLGGSETLSWGDMLRRIAEAAGRDKWILPMPIRLMWLAALFLDWLPVFPATRDQLTMLEGGNTADPAELAALIGREPRAFSAANLDYLG